MINKDGKVIAQKVDNVSTTKRPLGTISQHASSSSHKRGNFWNKILGKQRFEKLSLGLLDVVVQLKLHPFVLAFQYERVYSTALHLLPLDERFSVLRADDIFVLGVYDVTG